jgi:hypothetical protein
MTLTVRLDDTLAAALDRYCAATGSTKSLVVQESLAVYLVTRQPLAAKPAAGVKGKPAEPSANYRAFEAAGLIGAGALGGQSADKAGVRARVAERFAERFAKRKAQQGGA